MMAQSQMAMYVDFWSMFDMSLMGAALLLLSQQHLTMNQT